MTLHQRITAAAIALSVLILILELVRSRRLREEYSWLWLLTGSFVLVMLVRDEILDFLQSMIGATNHASTVYFFGNIFLMLICIQFSVRLSRMTSQIKTLGQKIALLEAERDEWRASRPKAGAASNLVEKSQSSGIEAGGSGMDSAAEGPASSRE